MHSHKAISSCDPWPIIFVCFCKQLEGWCVALNTVATETCGTALSPFLKEKDGPEDPMLNEMSKKPL